MIALDKKVYESIDVIRDVVRCEKNVGAGVLTVFPEVPKECTKIFELHAQGLHQVIHIKDAEKKTFSSP